LITSYSEYYIYYTLQRLYIQNEVTGKLSFVYRYRDKDLSFFGARDRLENETQIKLTQSLSLESLDNDGANGPWRSPRPYSSNMVDCRSFS
jgi:hypothetical protein